MMRPSWVCVIPDSVLFRCSTTPTPPLDLTMPLTSSTTLSLSWTPITLEARTDAPPYRPAPHSRHRVRADPHRSGCRVRLRRYSGLFGTQGGGVRGHPRQLQSRYDHD